MTEGKKFRLKLKSYKAYQAPVLLAVMALLAIVGVKIIFHSHAATQPPGSGAAASKITFWGNIENCEYISDAQLDQWKANGLGGLACQSQNLRGSGGAYFQATPVDTVNPPNHYEMQAALQKANISGRFTSRGLDSYLLFYTDNPLDPTTPWQQWWDDTRWNSRTIPAIQNLAAAAKMMGFTGIGIDNEPYSAENGTNDNVDYLGNIHTDQQTRDKVYQRGQQVMKAVLNGFPGAKFMTYDVDHAGDWKNKVLEDNNNLSPDRARKNLAADFWDGMTSVPGYGDISMGESTFYKSYNEGPSWDNAMQYDLNGSYASFSQIFRSWSVASSNKLNITPMVAINTVPGYPKTPASQTYPQLQAARKWGTGGQFINYAADTGSCAKVADPSTCPRFPHDFEPPVCPNWFDDYGTPSSPGTACGNHTGGSYIPGLQDAAIAGPVDTEPPTISLLPQVRNSSCNTVCFSGSAHDNIGIRSVSWAAGSQSGMATLKFHPVMSGATIQSWQMDWNFQAPVSAHTNVTITVTDAKGLITSTTVPADDTTSDNPPTVSLNASASLAAMTLGSSITLTAAVTPGSSPIAKVEFYDSGELLGTVNTAPYNYTWNTCKVYHGSCDARYRFVHNLTARAYDTPAGLNATSAVVPVTLNPSGADVAPPSQPTGLTATKTANRVTLSWSASTDNVGVDHYLILRDYNVLIPPIPSSTCPLPTSTSFTDCTVNPNTTYNNPGYQVVAVDAAKNQSLPSNPVTVATPASSVTVAAPTNLQSTSSAPYDVNLSWAATPPLSGSITGYRILRNGGEVGNVSGNTLSFTDYSAETGNTYSYTIRAVVNGTNFATGDQSPDGNAVQVIVSGSSGGTNNADFNSDGHINITDLSILASHWGSTTATHTHGDANGDGKVDITDLSILASQWGT